MRKFGVVVLLAVTALLAIHTDPTSYAQVPPIEFTCIGATTGAPCPDGTTSLRGFSTALPTPKKLWNGATGARRGQDEFGNARTPICRAAGYLADRAGRR